MWDRYAGVYDRFMKKDESAYSEITARIARRLGPEANILEIATGTGIVALAIAGRVRQIEAVDISPNMIEEASGKAYRKGVSNVHFAVEDAGNLPYGARSFEAVVIVNALHIMPEAEKALAEAGRVLKPGGYLIAPTFVHAGNRKAAFLSRLMFLIGFRASHRWTQESYLDFLEKNGFEIVEACEIDASFPIAYAVAVCGREQKTRI